MFEVTLSPEAAAFFENADAPLGRKLARCFEQLEQDPVRHGNIKRLSGDLSHLWRYRVGDWRVVYRVDAPNQQVVVLLIAHRREIYG